MAKYTLEEIINGDKYGIESAVFVEVFRMLTKNEEKLFEAVILLNFHLNPIRIFISSKKNVYCVLF